MTERKTAKATSARPADARRAEVDPHDGQIPFVYDDETYWLDPPQRWDIGVVEAVEDERYVSAVKLMLGEAQWRTFRSKKRVMEDLLGIFTAAEKAAGLRPGE